MDVVNNQETIFKMLAREGDCWHKWRDEETCVCGACFKGLTELGYHTFIPPPCSRDNPDLTTPDGAFWLLVRLPEWDRFEEFCAMGKAHLRHLIIMFPYTNNFVIKQATASLLTWLALDAKDGKAPALFNALCEFMGLEVEG